MPDSTPFDFEKLVQNLQNSNLNSEENPYKPQFNEKDAAKFVTQLCNLLESQTIPAKPLLTAAIITIATYIANQSSTKAEAISVLEYFIHALIFGVLQKLNQKES